MSRARFAAADPGDPATRIRRIRRIFWVIRRGSACAGWVKINRRGENFRGADPADPRRMFWVIRRGSARRLGENQPDGEINPRGENSR